MPSARVSGPLAKPVKSPPGHSITPATSQTTAWAFTAIVTEAMLRSTRTSSCWKRADCRPVLMNGNGYFGCKSGSSICSSSKAAAAGRLIRQEQRFSAQDDFCGVPQGLSEVDLLMRQVHTPAFADRFQAERAGTCKQMLS
eukprot:scaffold7357_cov195-Pinguiococcus_pyrenoidosus.AAC.11